MLKYMYFYNGAGVGAGDFNNDGLIDLFFASNQTQSKIYLNEGNLHFVDITTSAGIPDDGGWSTGVSVADVNNDGMLDIYVCRVGEYESLKSKNLLLICKEIDKQGVPHYEDMAASFGLDFSGFSTQATFFDYDLDGDLDMYLLNHSLRYNSTFQPRERYTGTADSLSGDRLYKNENGKFTDVSSATGIRQSVIGYGLGIVVSDFNLDGYPDIYIGNDFHENDYLYMNNQEGGFSEELTHRIMHTSQFSMGVDAGDINNDGWPDIISADMLPSDPYILRRSLGEDEYNTFQIKIRNGYNYQYARNALQLNRGNAQFTEVGLYASVSATDWSWSTLWADFDNDGYKDLFVSNGIPKRLNDIDYVNYVSNDEIQSKIRANRMEEKDLALINNFPEIKLPNRFFLNNGDASFNDAASLVAGNEPTFSNGAVYADLDNDGDLDIVVNNIDDPVLIYKNKTADGKKKAAIQLVLRGGQGNRSAIGTRVVLFEGEAVRYYEKYPVRGFQSSMEIPMSVTRTASRVDSAWLIWPDNTFQSITLPADSINLVKVAYSEGLPKYDFTRLQQFSKNERAVLFEDITAKCNLLFEHNENEFNEFDREPLMPFMVSREGPASAVADINNDGLDDIFIGSVKWEKPAIFIQQPGGVFTKKMQPALDADSTYEDVDASWTDVNGDGNKDLLVASGGNEYYGTTPYLTPRLYLNDGNGNLQKKQDAFIVMNMSASVIIPIDIDKDGIMEVFVGGRAVPFQYGSIPQSYLLKNDGTGKFTDITKQVAPELSFIGFVKDAKQADIDNDGDSDLLLALEWDRIVIMKNTAAKFTRQYLSGEKGWWNFILPVDIDNDGDIDLLAGNQGLNSRLKATKETPVNFYYNDFDGNGKKDQVITYYQEGQEIPFANKAELERQMPVLKKKFLYAEDFAKASVHEVFGKDKIKEAVHFSADYFANAIFINDGKMNFTVSELPWQAQLTAYRDAVIDDFNKDGLPDILLAGNFYPNNIQMGRYDADMGSVLINSGQGNFQCIKFSNIFIRGEVRHIRRIKTDNQDLFLYVRNNDSVLIFQKK
ncbi:MAG: VCBS repeat-containing protein [Chitinophagales bacterium]|nr:VCBS repeat-containing protein [Chitinophagales bacterium]